MRSLPLIIISAVTLLGGTPAFAQGTAGIFPDAATLQLADSGPYTSQQPGDDEEDSDDRDRRDRRHDDRDRDSDRPLTREEIRQRKRELREEERELAERERDAREERTHHMLFPRAWIGAGAGIGWASVDVPCSFGTFGGSGECSKAGDLGTYNANITVTGPYSIFRVRGVRQQDKGDSRHVPYEEAALVGTRFGHGNWYGLLGYGRILHPHDDYDKGDAHGLAWEIIFAPSSYGPMGLEVSFQGNQGADVSYFTANLGVRFGMLR